MARGDVQCNVRISTAVVSTMSQSREITIDSDRSVLHLKCYSDDEFVEWREHLKQHIYTPKQNCTTPDGFVGGQKSSD